MNKSIKYMVEVMQAFERGEDIEVFHHEEWTVTRTPLWNWRDLDYRVREKKPDTINWDHVHESMNYIARDADGRVFCYVHRPVAGFVTKKAWSSAGGHGQVNNVLASYQRGETEWDESLIVRPGFEFEE